MLTDLRSLRNIGSRSEEWLNRIGIFTVEQLLDLGSVVVYQELKAAFPEEISLNMLYALQGAILDIPWDQLPDRMKNDLREQINA